MPHAPILEIKGLHVRRDRTHLLHDVAWRIDRGQHWIVLGPNGSGKTTLLKVLLGFLSPTAGEISVLGRRYGRTDWREIRHVVSLVSSALHTHIPPAEAAVETVMSGRYAQLDLWAATTASDRRAARAAMAKMNLIVPEDRPWAYLSQGERQRVLIARALVAKPRLLILDEPCAGLDPVARADFLAALQRLAESPRAPALVFVTHHVEEITPAFTHVLMLSGGRVAVAGPQSVVMTNDQLSTVFGRSLRLNRFGSGWRLEVAADPTGIVE
jgi:iron complex transport system ATP-binding protein